MVKEEGSMNVAYPSKIPFGNSNSDIEQAFLEKELRKYCSYRYFLRVINIVRLARRSVYITFHLMLLPDKSNPI